MISWHLLRRSDSKVSEGIILTMMVMMMKMKMEDSHKAVQSLHPREGPVCV